MIAQYPAEQDSPLRLSRAPRHCAMQQPTLILPGDPHPSLFLADSRTVDRLYRPSYTLLREAGQPPPGPHLPQILALRLLLATPFPRFHPSYRQLLSPTPSTSPRCYLASCRSPPIDCASFESDVCDSGLSPASRAVGAAGGVPGGHPQPAKAHNANTVCALFNTRAMTPITSATKRRPQSH